MSDNIHKRPSMGSIIRRMFIGPAGLRAGWALAIFLVLAAAIVALIGFIVRIAINQLDPAFGKLILKVMHGAAHAPVAFVLTNEGPLLLAYAGALAVMTLIERQSFTAFGLGGIRRWQRLGAGFFWGFTALSLLIFLLWSTGHLVFLAHPVQPGAVLRSGVFWLIGCGVIALAEENLFRGYLLFRLKTGIGFWPAAVLLALLFGLAHGGNAGETHLGEIFAGLYGLVICISIAYTRSLWWAIGFHAAWDWAESYFYGTSDSGMISQGRLLATAPRGNIYWSGGPTGPEGSVFAFVALAFAALVMVITLRNAPMEARAKDAKPG
jgi:membrane protease YdiL (CAAX protease family)